MDTDTVQSLAIAVLGTAFLVHIAYHWLIARKIEQTNRTVEQAARQYGRRATDRGHDPAGSNYPGSVDNE